MMHEQNENSKREVQDGARVGDLTSSGPSNLRLLLNLCV